MKLGKEELAQYRPEIEELYHTYLPESPINGLIYFAIISEGTLQAVSALKCYSGHWMFRAAVVKPEFRGNGLQRELLREKLDYLTQKDNVRSIRVKIKPDNIFSIRNVEAEGFAFERFDKKLGLNVYLKEL